MGDGCSDGSHLPFRCQCWVSYLALRLVIQDVGGLHSRGAESTPSAWPGTCSTALATSADSPWPWGHSSGEQRLSPCQLHTPGSLCPTPPLPVGSPVLSVPFFCHRDWGSMQPHILRLPLLQGAGADQGMLMGESTWDAGQQGDLPGALLHKFWVPQRPCLPRPQGPAAATEPAAGSN